MSEQPICFRECGKLAGFTLIEMMIVLAITGILAALATPSFKDMIAEQRVRSAASDIVGDLASARIEAIKQQRRVVMERNTGGTTWKDGWRVFVDINGNNSLDAGTDVILKTVTGFGSSGSSTMKLCAMDTAFADRVVFRGDGTIGNAPAGDESGLRVSDGASRSRDIRLSAVGRASVDIFGKGEGLVCP